VHKFAYYAPGTIKEATALLARHGANGKVLAGGTDLLVQIKEHVKGMAPDYVVSLKNIKAVQRARFGARDGLVFGAGAKIAQVVALAEKYPALIDGAALIGSLQIQNQATLAGNICNAAPSADSVPPLMAYGAELTVAGPRKTRVVPIEEFFAGPGKTVLAHNEILVSVRVPAPGARTGCRYARHTPRQQMDIAMVGVAALVQLDRAGKIADARIVLGAVAPTPIRARLAEESLRGQTPSAELFAEAADLAAAEERPISDTRGSAGYRRYMTAVLVKRMLNAALADAQK